MISKIRTILLIAATGFFLVACGEKYTEPTDASLDGTWVYETTYLFDKGKPIDTIAKGEVFVVIRDKLIWYYTNGVYDSSFLYRIDKSNIFGVRTLDMTRFAVEVKKIKKGDDGKPLYEKDASGKLVLVYEKDEQGNVIYEKVVDFRPAKPSLPPNTGTNKEKDLAAFSFSSDGKLHLKYYSNLANIDNTNLVKEVVMVRPVN